MLYANKSDGVETIWNSRDGVSPFMVLESEDESEDGKKELDPLQHISWGGDAFAPFHVPNIGDRIFVDLTEERARASAYRTVERWWSDKEDPMSREFSDRATAVDALTAESMSNPGGPDVVVVDQPMQQAFLRKRLEYEARALALHKAALGPQGKPNEGDDVDQERSR